MENEINNCKNCGIEILDNNCYCQDCLKKSEKCPTCESYGMIEENGTFICPECGDVFSSLAILYRNEIVEDVDKGLCMYDGNYYYRLINVEFEENEGWVGIFISTEGEKRIKNLNSLILD